MPTVTIRLDDETNERLKRQLARSGETISDFIRDAVINKLDTAPRKETRGASLARVLARIEDTGETDLSTTYKARIRDRLDAKHRR